MSASVKIDDVGDVLYVRLREGKIDATKAFVDDRLVGVDGQLDLRGLPDGERLKVALTSMMPQELADSCDLVAD